jgi:hypothetical protein
MALMQEIPQGGTQGMNGEVVGQKGWGVGFGVGVSLLALYGKMP